MLIERGRRRSRRPGRGRRETRCSWDWHPAHTRLVDPSDDARRLYMRIAEKFEIVVDPRVHEPGRTETPCELGCGVSLERVGELRHELGEVLIAQVAGGETRVVAYLGQLERVAQASE